MDKVTSYINDCKNYGIQVLPPDVNESLWLFNVVEGNLRFGMGAVKNVGKAAVEEMVRERTENGAFTSFVDFVERVNLKVCGKRALESLVLVGAFDSIEKQLNRKTLFENLENFMIYGNKKQEEKALGQSNLFDLGESSSSSDDESLKVDVERVEDYDEKEKLAYESNLLGIYVSGHPLGRYQGVIEQLTSMNLNEIQEVSGSDKRDMIVAGMVVTNKTILTKKGDKMSFAMLEDLSGKIECIVFPRVFSEYEELLKSDDPVVMTGYVNLTEQPRKFFPQKIQKLKAEAESRVTGVRVSLSLTEVNERKLKKMKEVILSYKGSVPCHLIFESDEAKEDYPLEMDFTLIQFLNLLRKLMRFLIKTVLNLL